MAHLYLLVSQALKTFHAMIDPPPPSHSVPRFVTGVIVRERVAAFERVLWRACRGNVFLRQADIMQPLEDPTTVSSFSSYCFVIYLRKDYGSMHIYMYIIINIVILNTYLCLFYLSNSSSCY